MLFIITYNPALSNLSNIVRERYKYTQNCVKSSKNHPSWSIFENGMNPKLIQQTVHHSMEYIFWANWADCMS
jgi:hypothetical protein